MHVSVATLDGIAYEGKARAVHAPTESGAITVLDHHHPLVSLLKSGTLMVETEQNGEQEFALASGVLEVSPENAVHVLLNKE